MGVPEHRSRVRPEKFVYAREMRKNKTYEEKIVWGWLSNRRMNGFRFRQQHVMFGFIVDFYCPELRLVIEIDGDSHGTRDGVRWDAVRTRRITAGGFAVLRIRNDEVRNDPEMVRSLISEICLRRSR